MRAHPEKLCTPLGAYIDQARIDASGSTCGATEKLSPLHAQALDTGPDRRSAPTPHRSEK